ncbi:MAG: ARMT1-like domain-containing protein [Candidatus Pacebacteria bacterium]|nr:ARMT1-like domain-containing protein [Candidatus Paceibacterota bacterium]
MKTYFECIPCLVRQAVDSVRDAGLDDEEQADVLRTVLREMGEMDLLASPPAMSQRIHELVRAQSGIPDLYASQKKASNELALRLFPELREEVAGANDPLELALRLVIAGNIIDLGVKSGLCDGDVHESIEHAIAAPFDGDVKAFADAVNAADTILYLADNAGEIVFDRLLIERLPRERVTLAVKGGPIINDATRADAEVAGLCDMVSVIDNGFDAPGTILEKCSPEFRERFWNADLIIAKGQGNFETLSDVDAPVVFLLKAKCPVIARHLDCEIGSLVMRMHGASVPVAR